MSTKTKKTVKKASPVLTFNKKNAQEFAKLIFNDEKGQISYLKLCGADLKNGKDGGRTLHCAIGEAYFRFVDPALKEPLVAGRKDTYQSPYSYNVTGNDTATKRAIDILVEKAQLKDNLPETKEDLAYALSACVKANDDINDEPDISLFLERSASVSELWLERVVPLLK